MVLDTNVIVSGLLSPHGAPARVVDLALDGRLVPLHDERIVAEYLEVLARAEFGFDPGDVKGLVEYLEAVGEAVTATPLGVTLRDPDDLPFLEVAAAGAADALVTGNRRHFVPKKGSHTVPLCSPDELLDRFAP